LVFTTGGAVIAALRADLEIARRGYARYAAYPVATLAGLFTNTLFGFMRGFVLLALFEQRSEIGGYDAAATLTYTWLTQALIATVFIWGWLDLAIRIRSGDIVTDLVRPIHPLRAALANDLGRSAYHAVFRGVPVLLVGALMFDLIAPAGPLEWFAFFVSAALAVVVSFAFRFLYNIPAFWLLDFRGIAVLAMILSSLFSGFVIPIAFFPDWLAGIAHATPFPAMVQIPIDIFVGAVRGPQIAVALAVQAAWAAGLLLLCRVCFALGVRRLVVQGG